MNLSKIQKQSIIKQHLRIDKNSIIITLCDSNLKSWNEIYNTGIILTNCKGVIVPNRKFYIGRKTFNGKIVYLDAKKEYQVKKSNTSSKKLKVLASIPLSKSKTIKSKETSSIINQTENSFYFYDLTIYSEAFKYLSSKLSENMVSKIFLTELNQIYNKLKKLHPLKTIETLLVIKNKDGVLFKILEKSLLLVNKKDFQNYKLFDNFLLVSDTRRNIIPLFYNEKGKIKSLRQNLNKLSKLLDVEEVTKEIEKENPVENKEELPIKDQPNRSIATSLISQISKSNLTSGIDPESEEITIEINSSDLSKILKKHKIKDPDIVTNVQLSLNSYIEKTGKKIPKDKAETIVLQAINQTVHGTDKVSDEYLSNPNLLFSKLKEINTYKVPLKFPKLNYTVEPTDIIDINYTTGQFRQKFEFEKTIHENVHKLFESLENVSSNPIKIVRIKNEIKDDDLNRFIEYTVTLKNLTGSNKKQYDVKLKVPSPVNDKYFKIKGNNYIISSQQFLKPITKTEQKDVRLLTNYAIVRMELSNLRFNPSQLEEIINYLKIKYPSIIDNKNSSDDILTFKDGSIIYINDEINIYKDKDHDVYIDDETGKLKDRLDKDKIYTGGKYEFLFEIIRQKIAEIDPTDKLTKTKKSIPYLQIYMSGIKIPLILYLWMQKGLLHALNDFGIDYSVEEKVKKGKKSVSIPTSDKKYLVIYPRTFREEIVVNGLLVYKVRTPIEDFNNGEEIYSFINQHFGGTSTLNVILEGQKEGTFKDPKVLKLVDKMQRDVESLKRCGGSFSLADYLKRMNKVMHADKKQYDTIPNSRDLIAQYLLLYEMSGDPDKLWQVVTDDYKKANITLQLKSDNSKTLKSAIAIVEKYKPLFKGLDVSVNYAGSGYKALVFTDLIFKGQISSLALSLVIVIGLLTIMFKKLSLGLIGSIPIAITAIINFGIMGLLNIPLSTTTALISSIAIGIGIDYAIHFIERYHIYAIETKNKELTSKLTMYHSGRAIFFNAIVVISGFLVLLLSAFPPNRSLGLLISLNMLTSFIGTVTIVLILLYVRNIYFKNSVK